MKQLQQDLSRIFGGGRKTKAQPKQYKIRWADGSTSVLAKNGTMWWFKAPDGLKYGQHYQKTALLYIKQMGGVVEQ